MQSGQIRQRLVTFRHYLAVLLGLAALAAVAVGAFFNDSNEFGAMTLRKIGDGRVEIHRGNEVIEVDEGDEALEPQDLIVTGSDGDAVLKLEEGRTVHLARKSRLRIRSTTIVEAQQGSVLATADAPMQILFDDVTARLSSAQFRLDRGFGSARAASYRGSVLLESPGEPRIKLDRLFQVDVAAGDLPETSVPYRLSLRDTWDKQHLSEVVELTQNLDLSHRVRATGWGLAAWPRVLLGPLGFECLVHAPVPLATGNRPTCGVHDRRQLSWAA